MSTKKKYIYAGFGTWRPENAEIAPDIVQESEVHNNNIDLSYEWNIGQDMMFTINTKLKFNTKEEEKKNEH